MEDNASVIAALAWRLSQQAVKRMREAGFDIDVGTQYFEFVCEFLAFVLHAADRIAYRLLPREQRTQFTTALAQRLARLLDDNAEMLRDAAPTACGQYFIDLANRRAGDYASLRFDEGGPSFSFCCYFGNQVRELMPPKDRSWVVDQIIEVEAPDAVKALQKALGDLLVNASSAALPDQH